MLIDDGLPAPKTQIRVTDGINEAFIDMGYDEPMIGLDYEGAHHSEERGQYVYDIGRAELIERQGWVDIVWSQNTVDDSSCIECVPRSHAAGGRRQNCAEGCEFDWATALDAV